MRSFIGFGQVPYIGQPQSQPIKLGGIASQAIPLLFQWLSYGASTLVPNINVLVDISQQPCVKLDQIRSVYIDNLGSDNPIYVYFPDTGYTVSAKPNSAGWYPAYTNARQLWVIGEGFLTNDIPQTSVILSNLFLPPSVNVEVDNAVALWKASPTITRGNTIFNSAFGVPALGDQLFASAVLNLNTIGNTVPLWNTPFSSGFLYLTSLVINIIDPEDNSAAGSICNSVLESTGISGILMQPQYLIQPNTATSVTFTPGYTILSLTGLQIKLDATQTWRARVTKNANQGFMQIYSSYTTNPS